MTKFKVHFEASAAIGIELEFEAENRDEAERLGEEWLENNERKLRDVADDLFVVSDITAQAYGDRVTMPITHAFTSADEEGFELVDVWEDLT
jgi:hypothetical protein